MGFTAATDKIWPVVPDWTNNVTETLSWSTEVLRATGTGVSQHRGLRIAPARSIAFESMAKGKARRIAEMLLAGWSGHWMLPIWPDVQWLAASLPIGSMSIPCTTAGYDFVAGGSALLYDSVNTWEIVKIDTIAAGALMLSAATTALHGTGSRLYPLRRARVRDDASETLRNDDAGRRSITFDITEPCDFPALVGGTSYLTHAVLDVRPDETQDPTASFSRMRQSVDYGTSMPVVHDLPRVAFRSQQSTWKLWGRDKHSWFRSLLYTLQGQRVPIWVPSFTTDLAPSAAINGTSLRVEWAGYTQFGLGKPNRKDVRIELVDGSVFYRRITGAVEAGLTENLTIDSAISGASVNVGAVRQISFMALSTLASDDVEIDHMTDASGIAHATTGWKGVVPDV